jgi:hypothetical protein
MTPSYWYFGLFILEMGKRSTGKAGCAHCKQVATRASTGEERT